MRNASALALIVLLAACQSAPTPEEGAVPAIETVDAVEAPGPGFPVEVCRQLGSFAIAIADGRRDGITRDEALIQAQAGPLTGLFVAIVDQVYAADQPRDAVGWEMLRGEAAVSVTRSCVKAATGRDVQVRTRG